ETGTGKDVIATAIHDNSPRADKPFVVLDCGAISANLIESELFGHQRGAFTGAQSDRKGAFEQADGGTLFLDELGELPIDLQPKLLRAIERKQVRRVGGNTVISADVRIIAATNRDLAQEVGRGQFREDLFYRLAVASIHLPPLRQRKEDIVPLIDHFLAITPGGAKIKLRQRTIDLMRKHDWPGNVRELRNMVERAVFLSEVPDSTTQLHRGHPIASGGGNAQAVSSAGVAPAAPSAPAAPAIDIDVPFKLAKRATIDHFEREYVSLLLDRHSGNVSAAARAAGLDRMTLYRIIQRFGLRD
ncbi:MAG: sigma-54 dependent transcriptional regulator, partial [Myxococcota bacterium]